jgi:hypothetical protein
MINEIGSWHLAVGIWSVNGGEENSAALFKTLKLDFAG